MNQRTRTLTLMGLGVTLNIVGAFIALQLRLPIYLDSIGTILIACLLGPKYAVLTGVCGSIVSGITFDIYSLYFAPVQISTGFFTGIMYQKGFLKGKRTLFGVFVLTLPTSIISAIIAAFLFGGVTSSGSSYVVQILRQIGIPSVLSVFTTQIMTDYMDKLIAVVLVSVGITALPQSMKQTLKSKR